MEFKDLTEEQKERAKAAETPEEILAIAREEGIELSEAELDSVSGGWNDCDTYTGNKHDRFCRHYR